MQRQTGYVIGGVAITALILIASHTWWVTLLLFLVIFGVPLAGYAMLDSRRSAG